MSIFEYRSHAAHRENNNAVSLEDFLSVQLPSEMLYCESEEVNAMLEHLDDVIFEAVQGNESALKEAKTLWPQAVDTLGWELIEESREQYLRFALDIIHSDEQDAVINPEKSMAALDIVSLLIKN